MGKKTTQFINQIDHQLDEMRDSLLTLVGIADAYQQQRDTYAKLIDEMQKVDEKYMPSNKAGDSRFGSKRDLEGELARDPEKKRLTAKMEAAEKEMLDTRDWLNETRDKLTGVRDELTQSIKRFEKFINDKKASWFTSKKSVPDAERFIRNAKEVSRSVREVVIKLPGG